MTKNIIVRDQQMPSSTDMLFISKVNDENWLSTSKESLFTTPKDIEWPEKVYSWN